MDEKTVLSPLISGFFKQFLFRVEIPDASCPDSSVKKIGCLNGCNIEDKDAIRWRNVRKI